MTKKLINKIKACIFDLDGTVLDTIHSIAYFGNEALKAYGFEEIETDRYKILAGNGAKALVRRMLADNGCESEEIFEEVFQYYVTTYDNNFLYKTTIYEGIKELLDNLKNRGIKIAILSNKPHITTIKVVNTMFGEDYFDLCYGSSDGVPLKPDPLSLRSLMSELNVKANECLYIGDTATDMKTGKGAGIFTIGVLWGFRARRELEENDADLIISHPQEILDLIH